MTIAELSSIKQTRGKPFSVDLKTMGSDYQVNDY